MKIYIKAAIIWCLIVLMAILNGAFRESILNPVFGDKIALPLSGLILSVIIIVISYLLINWLKATDPQTYLKVGLFWGSLTIGFEYGLGYFVLHQPLDDIHQVFNLQQGNLFALALLTSTISPWLVAKIKHLI
ncbi:hypothetical protein GHNINEIG_00023 [Hydrogenovibrio crunogenus]|uniref:Uncharacterized protein n=1 Tax=Hydrogenovibrio crunogenus TaxID=39765 RepID=A0A4P7NWZ1_9GAMM|nr:hypothetical protein [Hydrogenovibrio crunogenus]QBZ81999.1 hypothetical protein GHNINEIG_00023 [Hydrogenovibrio crunogenus]